MMLKFKKDIKCEICNKVHEVEFRVEVDGDKVYILAQDFQCTECDTVNTIYHEINMMVYEG